MMVLERMLIGLQARRARVQEIRAVIRKVGSIDDRGDIDRLVRRFDDALEEVLEHIERAGEDVKRWFGEEKDADSKTHLEP